MTCFSNLPFVFTLGLLSCSFQESSSPKIKEDPVEQFFNATGSLDNRFETLGDEHRPQLNQIRHQLLYDPDQTNNSRRSILIHYIELFADPNTINQYDEIITNSDALTCSGSLYSDGSPGDFNDPLCVSLRLHCRGDILDLPPLDEKQIEICKEYLPETDWDLFEN